MQGLKLLSKDTNVIDRLQRIAARWVKSNCNWETSVWSMLSELQWPTLHVRSNEDSCKTYNILQRASQFNHLEIPTYITSNQYPFHFNTPNARTNFYHTSFFPKTDRDWNLLPISAIEAHTVNSFCNQLSIFFLIVNIVMYVLYD